MDKNFSLALGWWAARWLAHIWVIKYLEENNLKPDEISWTSMGAIIAALYAFWKNSQEMREICANINYFKLIDLNMKKWVLAWEKIKLFFEDIFKDSLIEDLPIKLKIVATDINTWERFIFTKWKIVDAIRSSISIPWIIIPNKIWNKDFVDWWIINNLPIDVLEWENVLAVSVLRDISRQIDTKLKIWKFEIKHNIFWLSYQILQKSIDIMMRQNEKASLKCWKNIIFLHPKFPKIDYYEFNKFDKIIDIWYKHSVDEKILAQMATIFIN